MNKKLITTMLCCFSLVQLTQAAIVDTAIWDAKDIKDNYKNKYFCNLSVTSSTCETNIANIKNDINRVKQDLKIQNQTRHGVVQKRSIE